MFGGLVQTLRQSPDQEMAILSPEAIKEKRALARKLMEQGGDYLPVASPWQGAARVSSGLLGALQDYWTTQDEQRGQKAGKEIEAKLMGSLAGGGSSPATASPAADPVNVPSSPSAAAAPAMTRFQQASQRTSYDPLFRAQEEENELPAGYLARTAQIESRTNPNAKNPRSSAGGMFQFIDATAEDYGLANRYDPQQATRAAAELAYDNKQHLMRVLGREPTAGELYLAHQQGAGGAGKMLANPNARAVDVVGAAAVRLNGGNANMTAGEFSRKWTDKFKDIQPAVATGGQSAPVIPAQAGQGASAAPQTPVSSPASTAPVSGDPSRLSLSQLMAMQNSPGFAYAPKGTQALVQALIQKQVTAETRDPRAIRLQELSIQEKERALNQTEMERVTGNDGLQYERRRGTQDQFQPVRGIGEKPIEMETREDPATGRIMQRPKGSVGPFAPVQGLNAKEEPMQLVDVPQPDGTSLKMWVRKGDTSGPTLGAPFKPKAQVEINNDQRQESEFGKKTGEALAKRFDDMVGEGDEAAQNLETVAELRRLGQNIKTGGGAVVRAQLGRLGVKLDGVSDIEAFNALVDRLTPQQRIAGSGATSDFDAKMFKGSLPGLMNTPEGNALIFDTMDKIVQNKIARGDIAMRVQIGEIKPAEALQEIRKLQNEAKALSDRVRDFSKPKDGAAATPSAPAAQAPAAPAAPATGQIRRFNPATGKIE